MKEGLKLHWTYLFFRNSKFYLNPLMLVSAVGRMHSIALKKKKKKDMWKFIRQCLYQAPDIIRSIHTKDHDH